jgi:quercetin dioxygenase-like cupin family protein
MISGLTILEMEGKEHTLYTNDTFVLPAGVKHALLAKEDSKLLLIR